MTNGNTDAQANEWRSRPLCRRYLLVIFDALPICVDEGGVVYDRQLHWALGVLADGQYEVSGVWPKPVSNEPNWEEIFEDLRVRGVEEIRFVLNGDSVAVDSVRRTADTGAAALAAGRKLGALSGLSPRHRCMAPAIEASMEQLQCNVRQAVDRHGCFSDLAEAASFVMGAFGRAQQSSGVGSARIAVASSKLPAVPASRQNRLRAKPSGRRASSSCR